MMPAAVTRAALPGLLTFSNEQFDRTRRLASALAGIELSERHRELLGSRSRRLGVHDTAGLDSLLGAAEEGETTATEKLLCLLTTKHTAFFRHPRHFDLAARHAVGAGHRARLWSAATATGEEAYSLAMILIEAFGNEAPAADVIATDIDVQALGIARRGEYGQSALRSLGHDRRERFLVENGARSWRIAPALRRLVTFRPVNLVAEPWGVEGPFDIILCRNVLMYLEVCRRQCVLERMASLLAPDGLLMLDPTEHPGKVGHLFAGGTNGVYSRRSERGGRPCAMVRPEYLPRLRNHI